MRGRAHDDETRRQVIADLLAGMGVREVARKLSLDPNFVSRVKASVSTELVQVDTEKRVRIDDLLLECVTVNMGALNRIATAASDPAYIAEQKAGDLALLYREVSNTTLDILEAASAAGIEPDAGPSIPEPGLPDVPA